MKITIYKKYIKYTKQIFSKIDVQSANWSNLFGEYCKNIYNIYKGNSFLPSISAMVIDPIDVHVQQKRLFIIIKY